MSEAARHDAAERRRLRRRRALRLGLVALLALELLYLVAANTFLWSRLGPSVINRRPEKLHVAWASAFSPLPGLVRVGGVEIRGQNRANQWHVRVDRAWVWVDLVRLPRRIFHTYALRARGAELRLRRNLPAEALAESEPAELTALPPIPGFELPSEPSPAELAPRRPGRRPWRLRFGGLRVHGLRDLWLGRYRLQSDTRLAGRLGFEIRGELQSDRLRWRIAGGTLSDGGEEPVARDIVLDARLSVAPFDPGQTEPADIFAGLDATVDVRGHVASLGFLDPFLAKAPWLDLDADGDLVARLRVEDGAILPGTRFRVEAEPLVATVAGHRVEGRGEIVGALAEAPAGEDAEAQMDMRIPTFTVHTPGGRELVRGDGFAIRLLTAQREIRSPADLRAVIDLPSSRIHDLGALDEYLPAPARLELRGGTGQLALHLEVDQPSRSGSGRVEAVVKDAMGSFGGTGFRGDLSLHADLDQIDATARSLTVAPARLRMERVWIEDDEDARDEAADAGAPGDWWGELELERGRFDFADGWRARGDVSLHLDDNQPLLELFVERKAFLSWFSGLLEAEDVRGSATVDVSKRYLRLYDLVVDAEHIGLAGDLELLEPKRKQGLLFARYRGLSVALELHADGRRDWKLTQSRRWFEARRAARRAE